MTTKELTPLEYEMARALTNHYDYIGKGDAIRWFMSVYGKLVTIGNMVRAYNSIDWQQVNS